MVEHYEAFPCASKLGLLVDSAAGEGPLDAFDQEFGIERLGKHSEGAPSLGLVTDMLAEKTSDENDRKAIAALD